jgi:vacuolar-type H+-ATPase subunit I/STV1
MSISVPLARPRQLGDAIPYRSGTIVPVEDKILDRLESFEDRLIAMEESKEQVEESVAILTEQFRDFDDRLTLLEGEQRRGNQSAIEAELLRRELEALRIQKDKASLDMTVDKMKEDKGSDPYYDSYMEDWLGRKRKKC